MSVLLHVIGGKLARAFRTGTPDTFVLRSTRPSAVNTGVPAGTDLTTVAGDYTASTAGAVVENLRVEGKLRVTAPNVTVRNCEIVGASTIPTTGSYFLVETTSGAVGSVIERCTIAPRAVNESTEGFRLAAGTVRRCHVRDVVDHFGITGADVVLEGNYAHSAAYFTPCTYQTDNQTHNDVVQMQPGATRPRLVGNVLEAKYGTRGTHAPNGTWSHRTGPTPAGQSTPDTAAIMCGSNLGSGYVLDAVAEDNWILGGYIPVNASGGTQFTFGRLWRNRFDASSAGGTAEAAAAYTALVKPDTVLDAGENTSNANTFLVSGAAVNIRRNG